MKDIKITVTGDGLYFDQHLSDLLRLLTCEQDRQRTAQCCLRRALPFRPVELFMCSV